MDQLISPDWLRANLDSPDLRVLDCMVVFERVDGVLIVESGIERWRTGHIPGSAHVDLVSDLADASTDLRFMMPPTAQVAKVMESVGVGDGTRVVLYDADKNMWAARVWWMLRSLGFDAAGVLDGGLRRWTNEARPVTTDPSPVHPTATFTMRQRAGYFVDKNDVLEAIDDSGTRIVNALAAAQHNGLTDDYGRRGHIPGAVNVPAVSLVDDQTHAYVGLDDLRSRARSVLDSPTAKTITYCGGGISAASGAFALTLLGVQNVAIYDASMGEWGYDESLPLTVPSNE
jgi:thiosulfate/3-mercaptopyruvate sulfurtransferase